MVRRLAVCHVEVTSVPGSNGTFQSAMQPCMLLLNICSPPCMWMSQVFQKRKLLRSTGMTATGGSIMITSPEVQAGNLSGTI